MSAGSPTPQRRAASAAALGTLSHSLSSASPHRGLDNSYRAAAPERSVVPDLGRPEGRGRTATALGAIAVFGRSLKTRGFADGGVVGT